MRKYRYKGNRIEGWMGEEELQWLYRTATQMNTILEIGSWMGRSTHALLCSGKPVVAVDHFKGSASQIDGPHIWAKDHDLYGAFKQNVGKFPNLFVMKMDSVRASRFFKDHSIDMIFIDGDHAYKMFRRDYRAWLPKCHKLLCGHDRNENGVPQLLGEVNAVVNLDLPDSLWSITVGA